MVPAYRGVSHRGHNGTWLSLRPASIENLHREGKQKACTPGRRPARAQEGAHLDALLDARAGGSEGLCGTGFLAMLAGTAGEDRHTSMAQQHG